MKRPIVILAVVVVGGAAAGGWWLMRDDARDGLPDPRMPELIGVDSYASEAVAAAFAVVDDARTPQTWMNWAMTLDAHGFDEEAAEGYDIVVRSTDDDKQSLDARWLGAVARCEDDPAAALTALEAIVAEHPAHGAARIVLGELYEQAGRSADAHDQFERARTSPFASRALWGLGRLAHAAGDDAAAIGHLQESVRLETNNRDAYELLAGCLDAAGQPLAARAARANARPLRAVSILPDAVLLEVESRNESFDGLLSRARRLMGAGDAEGAVPLADRALELNPTHHDARLLRGRLAYVQRDAVRANSFAGGLLRDRPDDAVVLDLAGSVQALLNNVDLARSYFEKAVESAPDNQNLRYKMAEMQRHTAPEAALSHLRHVAAIAPGDAAARCLAAAILTDAKRFGEAEQELMASLKFNPRHVETLFRCGILEVRRNNRPRAAEFFQKVLDVDPSHIGAREALKQTL